MSDALVVNLAGLQQASQRIQTAIDTLERQLGEVEREAEVLVAAWDGEARAAFERRQAAWRRAGRELSDTLREIRAAVDRSAADYLHTERRNANLFR